MSHRTGGLPKAAPSIELVQAVDDIPVASHIIPLGYEEADAKIREGAESFSFRVSDDCLGRVDVVSLGTKIPSEDRWDVRIFENEDARDTLYAGVYDGHNGDETSEVLRQSLVPYVANALASAGSRVGNPDSGAVIQKAFADLDARILDNAQTAISAGHPAGTAQVRVATGPAFGGSCALLLAYEPSSSTLQIALTGDSRAVRAHYVAGENTPVIDVLSKDQNLDNKEEFAHIAAAHPGEVDLGMTDLGGFLRISTTRAFGNHRWKWPADLVRQARANCHGPKPFPHFKSPPYMTASPEITTRIIGARDFVIIGSDGLWEAISNEDAVECVSRWAAARRVGEPEPVIESCESAFDLNDGEFLSRTARPEDFAIEDLDNAAVCLLKNVLGGRHRYMVAGSVTATAPISRSVRDDITVQVVFFQNI
ncbi:hypothetical protein NLG97_g2567 [Lecanicillium saksenae]|uniref:Uncharacterized protein n=1 Tax=Lecanicillium saksenae TaxID=468837 RepID=A0ACC1R369_9HYPO|nr:hypothetical protein NLG97_g2567 [Lecanicillium saksenae]